MPNPHVGERPSDFADRLGQWYSSTHSLAHKKKYGQYLTPAGIADFMASLFSTASAEHVRVLDPGAGAGILSCALCERLASAERKHVRVVLDAYELDSGLCAVLEKSFDHLRACLAERHVDLTSHIHCEDFVLQHGRSLSDCRYLFDLKRPEYAFDMCISNPPYFKLARMDPRARAAEAAVHGQPNIYSLFMAVSASMLKKDGEMVFITPRSFASGQYFRRFRERFFGLVQPKRIHVFASRRDAFKRDKVLQENIIIKAQRNGATHGQIVHISSSLNIPEVNHTKALKVPLSLVLDMSTKEKNLRIPENREQVSVLKKIESWNGSLALYGLRISTGPVVPFRAERFLVESHGGNGMNAPLLWMQNVGPMAIKWPRKTRGKPQYIRVQQDSLPLLVPDKNYVLLRRFSAKEEAQRLTAAPLIGGRLGSELIGIENHLNYIHRPGGSLSTDEAWGLAALYNSAFFNDYFRALSGNTQVSATEIRSIPLPPLDAIIHIGRMARECHKPKEVESKILNALRGVARKEGSTHCG